MRRFATEMVMPLWRWRFSSALLQFFAPRSSSAPGTEAHRCLRRSPLGPGAEISLDLQRQAFQLQIATGETMVSITWTPLTVMRQPIRSCP